MSSSRRILIGLVAGIAVGVFLGERATVFAWAADGVRQAAADDGAALRHAVDRRPASGRSVTRRRGRSASGRAPCSLGLWALALVFAFLIPLAFPHVQTASFFSTTLVERRPPFNFVDLYIPSNPFNSLANNVVPAVVLFSVVLGVALIGVERKQVLLDVLQRRGRRACRAPRAWRCGSPRTVCSRSRRTPPARSTSSSSGGCRSISSPTWRSRCWSVSGCCPGSSPRSRRSGCARSSA